MRFARVPVALLFLAHAAYGLHLPSSHLSVAPARHARVVLVATDTAVSSHLSVAPARHARIVLAATDTAVSAEQLVRDLFGSGTVDPSAVAAACAPSVVWDDMGAKEPCEGPAAVQAMLEAKFPAGSILVLDKVSDGVASGGFIWHREASTQDAEEGPGLRGTTFVELDAEGRLVFVQEGCEPQFKAGEATEALLKAATANQEKPVREKTYTERTPGTAEEVARYLWQEAYPGGASPSEALRLFSPDIEYQDFNYKEPFVGLAQVKDFVEAFDIAGVDFIPVRISQGTRRCCFTWATKINGNDGPSGISFYEVDDEGAVVFIRDIPAPFPRGFRPLADLAAAVDPARRMLSASKLFGAGLGVGSQGMGLLKPVFAKQATWQAEVLAGGEAEYAAAKRAAQARLDAAATSAPLVIYTYGLSPFSTEALKLLDATGASYREIELGPEWFLLDADGSATRAELLARHGMSSLPHVFIGGESIGGLYSGSPGLVELQRSGELRARLKAAGAL